MHPPTEMITLFFDYLLYLYQIVILYVGLSGEIQPYEVESSRILVKWEWMDKAEWGLIVRRLARKVAATPHSVTGKAFFSSDDTKTGWEDMI
jgi:hypothetical protein